MADENRLSVVKRKGLVDHLLKTSQQPQSFQEAYGPRQRPFIRRSKTHLDSLTALRKKEAIVKSGAYERSHIAPPKGKEINDREKEKLIHRMAYRCDPPDYPDIQELFKQRITKKIDIEITPRTRENECKRIKIAI